MAKKRRLNEQIFYGVFPDGIEERKGCYVSIKAVSRDRALDSALKQYPDLLGVLEDIDHKIYTNELLKIKDEYHEEFEW